MQPVAKPRCISVGTHHPCRELIEVDLRTANACQRNTSQCKQLPQRRAPRARTSPPASLSTSAITSSSSAAVSSTPLSPINLPICSFSSAPVFLQPQRPHPGHHPSPYTWDIGRAASGCAGRGALDVHLVEHGAQGHRKLVRIVLRPPVLAPKMHMQVRHANTPLSNGLVSGFLERTRQAGRRASRRLGGNHRLRTPRSRCHAGPRCREANLRRWHQTIEIAFVYTPFPFSRALCG